MDLELRRESWGIGREVSPSGIGIFRGGYEPGASEGKFGLSGPLLLLLGRGCTSRGVG